MAQLRFECLMADFARKSCLLGDFGLGKSSLVTRVLRHVFFRIAT